MQGQKAREGQSGSVNGNDLFEHVPFKMVWFKIIVVHRNVLDGHFGFVVG